MTEEEAAAGRSWQRAITRVVAAEIRRYRDRRGWSTQRLAAECSARGFEVARSTLAGMETGRRENISVAELLIIARALDVSPAALLVPVGPHVDGVDDTSGWVEMAPGERLDVGAALAWVDGTSGSVSREPLADVRYHGRLAQDWVSSRARAETFRRLAAENPADQRYPAEADYAEKEALTVERELSEHRRLMRARGETPPPLPSDVLTTIVDMPQEGDPYSPVAGLSADGFVDGGGGDG